jgi:plastocyanin
MSPRFTRVTSPTTRRSVLQRWIAAVAFATLALAAAAGSAFAADADVSMIDLDFEPQTVTIEVGDSVTWTNDGDLPHTATAAGDFDTGLLNPGESDTVTFDEAGSFAYICTVHPDMTGTVVVEAAGTTAPGPTDDDSAEPTLPAGTDTVTPVQTGSPGVPLVLVVLLVVSAAVLAGTFVVDRVRTR